jgi:two-component system heavy metal sensor histidine kinase CusS
MTLSKKSSSTPFAASVMHSKRNKPPSIATELVVLFTIAAALVLSCALGALYWMVVRHASTEDSAVLADKVRALETELQEPDGLNAIDQDLKTRRPGEATVYWVRVLDPDARVVTETPGMARLLPGNVFPAPRGTTSSWQKPKLYRVGGRLFSLIAVAENIAAQPYAIQVAQDRSADDQFQRTFRALLAIALALGILLSALIATVVTKRGLRPLREMTRSVGQIGPTHLNERLTPIGWPHEIEPLAVAFDEMLDRLENSFTRLSQFSADLAHELRTPIANVLGEAQVTLTRARTSDQYREVIESTVAECERLSGIVDNLLFLARADAAREHIQRTVFNGRAAIEKTTAYYRTLAEDRNVTLVCDGEGQVYGDQLLFGRALSNLLENALRFTPPGGAVRVSIGVRDAHCEISVSDTGAGITPEHLPRVFDRFYRADSSRSPHGAGLGLSLVKSILDLHGGSAKIESEVGRGTTVVLNFPNDGRVRDKG